MFATGRFQLRPGSTSSQQGAFSHEQTSIAVLLEDTCAWSSKQLIRSPSDQVSRYLLLNGGDPYVFTA
jgi:hypothetical protein